MVNIKPWRVQCAGSGRARSADHVVDKTRADRPGAQSLTAKVVAGAPALAWVLVISFSHQALRALCGQEIAVGRSGHDRLVDQTKEGGRAIDAALQFKCANKLGADIWPPQPQPRCGVVVKTRSLSASSDPQHTTKMRPVGSSAQKRGFLLNVRRSPRFVSHECLAQRH